MVTTTYVIFIATYILIASRRLSILPIGRPAGALLGAVAMVVIGALTPEETYRAIDHDTILLLFATMGITVHLEEAGLFDRLSGLIVRLCRRPSNLLTATAVLSGTLSAVLVNDTVCLFLTPVVLSACRRGGLPVGPFLIAVATSANIGSAATLVGNPQNMIIGNMSGISFARFVGAAGPPAALGLLLNVLLLRIYYRKRLPLQMRDTQAGPNPASQKRLRQAVLVTIGVVAGFFTGLHLAYTALTGLMILIILDRRDPREMFSRIDWPLLLFFCCLFIVVAGLAKTGIIEGTWRATSPYFSLSEALGLFLFSILMTAGSNLISNVPMVLMTGPYLEVLGRVEVGWVLLAFTTTVAGNLTLIGSVANIIVAERAKEHYCLGFFEYLRFGVVSTFIVTATGVALIYILHF